jgi:hypothetical protein
MAAMIAAGSGRGLRPKAQIRSASLALMERGGLCVQAVPPILTRA